MSQLSVLAELAAAVSCTLCLLYAILVDSDSTG